MNPTPSDAPVTQVAPDAFDADPVGTLSAELAQCIAERRFDRLKQRLRTGEIPDVAEAIDRLPAEQEAVAFRLLDRERAFEVFEHLSFDAQEHLLHTLSDADAAAVLEEMSADDRTALLEELPGKVTVRMVNLLSAEERATALQLLGYPEDSIGRLMTPDYVRVKPAWTVAEALAHVRVFGEDSETLNVLYVTGSGGVLIDDLRIRQLLTVDPETRIESLMDRAFVALNVLDDQETAVATFRRHDRTVLPVVDGAGVLVGIVTVDDVLDVQEREATEDIQMLGGVQALDDPYLQVPVWTMVRKRGVWLVILLFGGMLTAEAMSFYEEELASAVVLAIFLPLIIASGGNSGAQAATLITRALALGEVRLTDWWWVMRRELASGFLLGVILGALGAARIALWALAFGAYGEHWPLVMLTVGVSLVGVVVWGSLSGSLLPLLLKRLGADPATSSAPFIATLVDVTGIIIFFTIATWFLSGTLL
ncbi:MAG: magnesium transporter [Trueperaceae bacterium]|nr:magnesium transporter [Trueperaceae bacterium]